VPYSVITTSAEAGGDKWLWRKNSKPF